MPLFTPHGLKIRLDPDGVAEVVRPLASVHDMNDVLLDVELWENLPEGLVALSASATAALTRSPLLTIGAGVAAYAIGSFVRSFMYSDVIRRAIPMFIGSWIVTALHTLAVSAYLAIHSQLIAAVVLCVLNIAAHSGVLGVLDFVLAPIRVPLRRMLRLQPTHQEAVFVAICNRRAARYGLTLDWSRYSSS